MISAKQAHLLPQAQKEYRLLSSWHQLRQWHRKWTPSVDDEMFRLYMKSYAGEAWKLSKQNILLKNHYFMLSETRPYQPQEQEKSEQQTPQFRPSQINIQQAEKIDSEFKYR